MGKKRGRHRRGNGDIILYGALIALVLTLASVVVGLIRSFL